MNVYELIQSRRTIRQFKPVPVPRDLLSRMVDAARLAPSAANKQPLEFLVVDEKAMVDRIFPSLKWAAYIKPEGNPKPGQEPRAYILTLVNEVVRKTAFEWDAGAAIENMILTALDEGVGSCWILSVDKKPLMSLLKIPGTHSIDSVLALGYPAEEPVVEEITGSVKYWKDETGTLHVPKRTLETVLHYNGF